MDVAVIICTYTVERWEMLTRAVDSVHRQTLAPQELILVVDGDEELRQRATTHFARLTVVASRHGQGLSGARQTGVDLAQSPILAFLDDDAIAEPHWLAELTKPYTDPDVLGVGGPVEPLWLGTEPQWLPPEFYWIVGCTYTGMPITAGRIRNPIGANMSMRADVLADAGSFVADLARRNRGARFSGTADETELCIRAAQLRPGGYWLYRPQALVRHLVPAERTTWRYFLARCRVEAAAKAILAGLTGTRDGLSSERHYVRSVLPRAVCRELVAAARGRPDGLLRAATIVAGLVITAVSYGLERGQLRWRQPRGRVASARA